MNTQLATTGDNPFLMAASNMGGGENKTILKFSKGDWMFGQDSEEMPIGTKLAADIMNAEWGWVRWHDRKPVERRVVPIASGAVLPSRDALGHDDKDLWPRGDDGREQDPWQKTIEIGVRELTGDRREFLMVGTSKGFEGACKKLFSEFGKAMREQGGKVPVIELGVSKYKHSNAAYGIIKTPEMPIVEWFDPSQEAPAAAKSKAKF